MYGFISFKYSSSANRFVLAKNLQLYCTLLLPFIIIFIGLFITYFEPVKFNNLIIKIATPLNFISLMADFVNSYAVFYFKRNRIVELLNTGLKIDETIAVNSRKFKFSFLLFLRTFAMDSIFIIGLAITIYRSYFVHHWEISTVFVINSLQFCKCITRYMTHIHICCINYQMHLLRSIEFRIVKAVEEFDKIFKENPRYSKHQHILACCQLSDKIDFYGIQCGKILELTKATHSLFSRHILMVILQNLMDVLILVRFLNL